MEIDLDTVIVEFDADTGVGKLILNRPDSLNALNSDLRSGIISGLEKLDAENGNSDGIALRAVIIEGAGGNFCAGADINEFNDAVLGARAASTHYEFIRNFQVPIIAKIRGYCLGGGLETAMSCDFRLAHEDAKLGLPEVDLGVLPGAGGVHMLSRLTSSSTAKEVAMTGDFISADRACDLGVVEHVYETEFDEAINEFAETIASKPPLSIQAIKRSATLATQVGLEEGIEYDQEQFKRLLQTEDHEEGARAFAEDEYAPTFRGR